MDESDIVDELREPTKELREQLPNVWAGFAQMHRAAVANGVIPGHIKEIMALAIGVAKQCDGCIAYHSRAAARAGATLDEVTEGLGVAILMGGGPATVYAARAQRSYRRWRSEQSNESAPVKNGDSS